MTTDFIRALKGTCSGTAVFAALREQSLRRALWHLLLILLLGTAVMCVGVCPRVLRIGRVAVAQTAHHCGGLRLSAQGMTPLREPEKARGFLLPGAFLVTYLGIPAEGEAVRLPTDFPGDSVRGILWMPDRLAVWSKEGADDYRVSLISSGGGFGNVVSAASPQEMLTALLRSPEWPWRQLAGEEEIFSPTRLRAGVELLLLLTVPVVLFFQALAQVLLYILMFVAVFGLMSLGRQKRTSVREVAVLAVYAGFPAILLGSLAVALDLPYLDFNLVYVLGMTGYLMAVMNRLDRDRQRGRQDKL